MRLLLTGGTGFFGKALLRHWIELESQGKAPPTVTLLTRSPVAFARNLPELAARPWLELLEGDVLVPDSLPRTRSFTHILHGATDSTLGPQLSPLQRFDQIVDGTRNLLDLAVDTGAARFLLTSSGGVYGPAPPGLARFTEGYLGMADPLKAGNAYSVGKRASEHLCALYQELHGVQAVIARCFAFVGRDLPLDAHFAIGNFIRDALTRPDIVVGGDGSPVRSYMDQRDLARWLMELLERAPAGEAFNVGSDEGLSIRDIAHLVRDLLAPGKPVRILGANHDSNPRNFYVPSIDKARASLGLELRHSLSEAILETAVHVR